MENVDARPGAAADTATNVKDSIGEMAADVANQVSEAWDSTSHDVQEIATVATAATSRGAGGSTRQAFVDAFENANDMIRGIPSPPFWLHWSGLPDGRAVLGGLPATRDRPGSRGPISLTSGSARRHWWIGDSHAAVPVSPSMPVSAPAAPLLGRVVVDQCSDVSGLRVGQRTSRTEGAAGAWSPACLD